MERRPQLLPKQTQKRGLTSFFLFIMTDQEQIKLLSGFALGTLFSTIGMSIAFYNGVSP